MKYIKFNKVISIILIAIFFINFMPIDSFAHDAYFFQVLMDENTMTFMGNIVPDRASTFNHEKKHIEAQLYDTNGKDPMFFTFPSFEVKKPTKNNVTSKDIDRAYEIRDTLIPNLNEILKIVNDGNKYDSIVDLKDAAQGISTDGQYNGWTIEYNDSENNVTITKGDKSYTFLYRMIKGYNSSTLEDGRKSPIYVPNVYNQDTKYIAIQEIIEQAVYAFDEFEHLAEHAGEYNKPGTLEVKLSEFMTSVINGIRSLLGLYGLDEMVYNKGIRDTRGFYGGIMSNEWMEKTMTFHMIFQAIAWIILTVAIVKLLFQRNLATINPAMRVSLIDGIKDLLITGFMLIALFVLINTVIKINERLVAIFATTIPDYAGFTGINNDYQTFAGSIMQLYYLFITIYLNFVYIVRGITLAVLIASAPFFVVSIAFESKGKKLFTSWMKEFIGNLFLQTFHAFILSMFLSIQMSTRGIELAIISFALIPLTKLFKSLIVGQSGDMSSQLSSSAVGGLTMGVMAGMGGRSRGSRESSGGGSSNSSSGDSSNNSGGVRTKNSSDIPGSSQNPERREHSTGIPDKKNTSDALNRMETDLKGGGNAEDNNYTRLSNKIDGSKEELTMKDVGKSALGTLGVAKDIAVGAGKVAIGATATMALGGEAGGRFIRSGMQSIGSGFGNVTSGGKKAFSGTVSAGKRWVDGLKIEKGGNILGAETLESGDTVIHRDKTMLKHDGLNDVKKTSEGNIAMTYNRNSLSSENQQYLDKIETAYKNGTDLKGLGIETVSKNNNGNTVVHYNQHGANQLGFKDMYMTSGNRVVETKGKEHGLNTNLVLNLDNAKKAPYDNYTNGGKNSKNKPLDMDNIM